MVQEPESDLLAMWSLRLAERLAPDEIDVAADLAFAYAAGGADRRTLFLRPRTDPGAFGAGAGLFLPYLWQALDTGYTTLRVLLSDPSVANIIAIAGLVLSYRQARKDKGHRRPDVPAADAVDAAVDVVRRGLEQGGLEPDEAERKAIGAVEELLRDPGAAAVFLDRLRGKRGKGT